MSRILLLHASVGMGHHRAAVGIARALKQVPGITVEVEDTLDHARELFRTAYAGSYLRIADQTPQLWSEIYARTDRRFPLLGLVNAIRMVTTMIGVRGLAALLQRTQPDAIICTHFLPLEVLGPLRHIGQAPPLYGVLTDYRAHHFWACQGVDGYFVPTVETREQLVTAGLPEATVHVTGIPIDPAIAVPLDQKSARQSLALAPDEPVVLINGSGLAPARVKEIVVELLSRQMPGTLVVATGRNHQLTALLADMVGTTATELRVLGPQPSLDPLIAASDVVMGKAGGLTVSEVLARGVPLIVLTPVPGQEAWNARHVVEAGAGVCESQTPEVAEVVVQILQDQSRRQRMARAAKAAGQPAAAAAIAGYVLEELRHEYMPLRLRSVVPA
ncbi:MAG: galactosyldiacylglycerol synthase [Herpetosiphonaceae bacterium]|nr:galactosyldiacylglycerol synthase [Herpetosiphonaceae bacterium]